MNYIKIEPELTKKQSALLEKMEIGWYTVKELKQLNGGEHADFIANELKLKGVIEFKHVDKLLYYRRLPPKRVKVTDIQYEVYNVMNKLGAGWLTASSIGYKERTLQALYYKGLINCLYPKLYHNPTLFQLLPTLENMGIKDIGEMSILEANSLNVPIDCHITSKETADGNTVWEWWAANYTPQHYESIHQDAYHLQADKKERLLWAVNKYVTPLYKQVWENLQKHGVTKWDEIKLTPVRAKEN